jgi:L-asparagine transporter-like permease
VLEANSKKHGFQELAHIGMGKWTGFFVKRWALWVFLLEIVF